ncbi:hypothetical protein GOODEAATRI_014972, partial [Goodea atripinnis]
DIVQQILGCEWDDELNKVEGYKTYSLNGEDYIRLDTETATWVALSPKAEITEKEWNKKEFFGQSEKDFLTINVFEDLKLYYNYAKNSLHRKETSSDPMVAVSVPVLVAVLAAVVILIAAVVFTVHRRKKAPDSIHELSERLNPEKSTSNTAHSRTSIVDSPS